MKKIGSLCTFAGVVMLIGPFFGFTIRGQQETSSGEGAILGLIFLVVGIIILNLKKETK